MRKISSEKEMKPEVRMCSFSVGLIPQGRGRSLQSILSQLKFIFEKSLTRFGDAPFWVLAKAKVCFYVRL